MVAHIFYGSITVLVPGFPQKQEAIRQSCSYTEISSPSFLFYFLMLSNMLDVKCTILKSFLYPHFWLVLNWKETDGLHMFPEWFLYGKRVFLLRRHPMPLSPKVAINQNRKSNQPISSARYWTWNQTRGNKVSTHWAFHAICAICKGTSGEVDTYAPTYPTFFVCLFHELHDLHALCEWTIEKWVRSCAL